ncbi:MAG TPA: YraN family protein [Planctomycetota bacterium]|nr:YraN family protein [Planctomycetota bacterium]
MANAELGKAGEDHAWELLRKRGDKLICRNFSCAQGELDLVTWDKETLVFTEVRARTESGFGSPAETISEGKQKRLRRAANWFLAKHCKSRQPPACRFDVVWIVANEGKITQSGIILGAFY